ncbi:ABC transporter ATP-binding protein, partial [Thermodesulfobacteriota bacterium]
DEPTSVLTPQEINELFRTLKGMREAGHLIILISHKLDEIFEICDRVVVLQKGTVVGDVDIKDVDKKALARMMVGRDVIFNITKEKLPRTEKVLSVKNVVILGDKGNPTVNGITFEVFKNEIFGIAGVSGNGQKELVEGITGLRSIESGQIEIKGVDITNKSARCIYDSGISHVPEERIKFGIAPGLCLYENSILKQHHRKQYRSKLLLAYQRIKDHASDLISNFNVSAPSIHVQTKNLSGGNIQKLILGREISENPELLVASHPTYGLDVGATEYLRRQLLDQTKAGGAVLLVSEDLEELFELCDRIAVIFRGTFTGILEPDDPRISDIGLMMAGSMNLTAA